MGLTHRVFLHEEARQLLHRRRAALHVSLPHGRLALETHIRSRRSKWESVHIILRDGTAAAFKEFALELLTTASSFEELFSGDFAGLKYAGDDVIYECCFLKNVLALGPQSGTSRQPMAVKT